MQTELIKELNKVLKAFPQFWNGENLHRSMVSDAISKKQPDLIKALVANEKIRSVYGTDINGILIFDFEKLCSLLRYKEYWKNSFTKYRNKIGLTSSGKYISDSTDVLLDFPFKDCVLEGGMKKENEGKDEIYYNEIIARDEIDNLLSPKALVNASRHTKDGEVKNIHDFHEKDNLIIKGNNLIALHSLLVKFTGKIKLIYIDPPYNTGSDSFKYNDNFNHSSWLTFIKNRLEVAKELLSEDGVIFVQSDDNEQAYLKVLMDSIFDRKNFINMISVNMKNVAGASGGGEDKRLKKNCEFILIYSKNYDSLSAFKNVFEYTEIYEVVEQYKKEGKNWHYSSVLVNEGEKIYVTSTADGSGNEIKIYRHPNAVIKSVRQLMVQENISEKDVFYNFGTKIFEAKDAQSSIRTRVAKAKKEHNVNDDVLSIEYIPKSGKNKGQVYEQFYKGDKCRLFAWLRDITENIDGVLYKRDKQGTYWDFTSHMNNLMKEGEISFQNGKKPEALIQRIIDISTNKGDIVLDFHLGSGTTAATAHKMERRYIGIEQMDYINDITVPRLKNVITAENNGISRDVGWQGGGSFVYAELMELNAYFVHEIQKAQSNEELEKLFAVMKTEAHLNYQVALQNVLCAEYEMDGIPRKVAFSELELHEQKQLLIEILDKNQLYVNASDMDDSDLNISESDKAFTRSFYGME
ncbi:TPA: site-specific DNA-methyltransferase [Klebsiella aerogenes]|nr:site-specific DNA-methyltransferase [Klebsiella aerogenes]